MTADLHRTEGLTVRDERGNSLVFERWDDGQVSSWSLDEDERETRSVLLSADDRIRVAAFLLGGLA